MLRRPLPEPDEAEKPSRRKAGRRKQKAVGQMTLDLPETIYGGVRYEYSVLVTSLSDEVLTLASTTATAAMLRTTLMS